MSKEKIVFAVWIIVLLYSVSSFLVGKTGLMAQRDLTNEYERLSENLEELSRINTRLGSSLELLRTDADTISVCARELGLARKDERIIRVVGLPTVQKRTFSAGRFLGLREPDGIADTSLRIFAIICGLLLLCTLFLVPLARKNP